MKTTFLKLNKMPANGKCPFALRNKQDALIILVTPSQNNVSSNILMALEVDWAGENTHYAVLES